MLAVVVRASMPLQQSESGTSFALCGEDFRITASFSGRTAHVCKAKLPCLGSEIDFGFVYLFGDVQLLLLRSFVFAALVARVPFLAFLLAGWLSCSLVLFDVLFILCLVFSCLAICVLSCG